MVRKSFRRVAVLLAVTGLAILPSGGSMAWAGSSLPPLASLHSAKFPPNSASIVDSCTVKQYQNTKFQSVYLVDLRGLHLSLLGPVGWTCDIVDGNGSGASIHFGPTKKFPYGPTGDIKLNASADMMDNGANFCPYTTTYKPSAGSCHGHTSRPKGEEVRYLFGSAASKSMAVVIADPSGDRTPFSGRATEPTITVLAVTTGGAAYDFVCAIGNKLSSLCVTDATQFDVAVHRLR
jgi:hypothetical protein